MQRLFLFFLLLVTLAGSCSRNKNSFEISIHFKRPVNSQFVLSHLGLNESEVVDSTSTANSSNEFVLKGNTTHPELYSLNYLQETVYLFIKPGDQLVISIDNTNPTPSYYVKGSTDSRLIADITRQNQQVRKKISEVSMEFRRRQQFPETFMMHKQRLDSIYDKTLSDYKQYTIEFIEQNIGSVASVVALYQDFGIKKSMPLFDKYADIDIFIKVDSVLSKKYPNTEAILALNRDLTEIKDQLKHKTFSEKLIQEGHPAPMFEVLTLNRDTIILSDYSDEVVIYAFFAVWDEASVKEILKISELYKIYKRYGVNIIAVSFDISAEKLEQFISGQNIEMPVACDYNYWDSEYVKQFGVRFIPDILLLDKTHYIHKKNLSSDELNLILSEWKKEGRL